jgi:hypothetical protein
MTEKETAGTPIDYGKVDLGPGVESFLRESGEALGRYETRVLELDRGQTKEVLNSIIGSPEIRGKFKMFPMLRAKSVRIKDGKMSTQFAVGVGIVSKVVAELALTNDPDVEGKVIADIDKSTGRAKDLKVDIGEIVQKAVQSKLNVSVDARLSIGEKTFNVTLEPRKEEKGTISGPESSTAEPETSTGTTGVKEEVGENQGRISSSRGIVPRGAKRVEPSKEGSEQLPEEDEKARTRVEGGNAPTPGTSPPSGSGKESGGGKERASPGDVRPRAYYIDLRRFSRKQTDEGEPAVEGLQLFSWYGFNKKLVVELVGNDLSVKSEVGEFDVEDLAAAENKIEEIIGQGRQREHLEFTEKGIPIFVERNEETGEKTLSIPEEYRLKEVGEPKTEETPSPESAEEITRPPAGGEVLQEIVEEVQGPTGGQDLVKPEGQKGTEEDVISVSPELEEAARRLFIEAKLKSLRDSVGVDTQSDAFKDIRNRYQKLKDGGWQAFIGEAKEVLKKETEVTRGELIAGNPDFWDVVIKDLQSQDSGDRKVREISAQNIVTIKQHLIPPLRSKLLREGAPGRNWTEDNFETKYLDSTELNNLAKEYNISMAYVIYGQHALHLLRPPEKLEDGRVKLTVYDPFHRGERSMIVQGARDLGEIEVTKEDIERALNTLVENKDDIVEPDVWIGTVGIEGFEDGVTSETNAFVERLKAVGYDMTMPEIPGIEYLSEAKMEATQKDAHNCTLLTLYHAATVLGMQREPNEFKEKGNPKLSADFNFHILTYEEALIRYFDGVDWDRIENGQEIKRSIEEAIQKVKVGTPEDEKKTAPPEESIRTTKVGMPGVRVREERGAAGQRQAEVRTKQDTLQKSRGNVENALNELKEAKKDYQRDLEYREIGKNKKYPRRAGRPFPERKLEERERQMGIALNDYRNALFLTNEQLEQQMDRRKVLKASERETLNRYGHLMSELEEKLNLLYEEGKKEGLKFAEQRGLKGKGKVFDEKAREVSTRWKVNEKMELLSQIDDLLKQKLRIANLYNVRTREGRESRFGRVRKRLKGTRPKEVVAEQTQPAPAMPGTPTPPEEVTPPPPPPPTPEGEGRPVEVKYDTDLEKGLIIDERLRPGNFWKGIDEEKIREEIKSKYDEETAINLGKFLSGSLEKAVKEGEIEREKRLWVVSAVATGVDYIRKLDVDLDELGELGERYSKLFNRLREDVYRPVAEVGRQEEQGKLSSEEANKKIEELYINFSSDAPELLLTVREILKRVYPSQNSQSSEVNPPEGKKGGERKKERKTIMDYFMEADPGNRKMVAFIDEEGGLVEYGCYQFKELTEEDIGRLMKAHGKQFKEKGIDLSPGDVQVFGFSWDEGTNTIRRHPWWFIKSTEGREDNFRDQLRLILAGNDNLHSYKSQELNDILRAKLKKARLQNIKKRKAEFGSNKKK